MIATLSTKGETMIPEAMREAATLRAGDKKGCPLRPRHDHSAQTNGSDIAENSRAVANWEELPVQTEGDEAKVLGGVRRVRARRK